MTSGAARSLGLDLHYRSFTPGRFLRNFIFWPFTLHEWNYDGDLVANKFNLYFQGELLNRWKFGEEQDYFAESPDDRLTRGGPLDIAPAASKEYFSINSPASSRLSFSSEGSFRWNREGPRDLSLNAGLVFQQRANIQLQLNPVFGLLHAPAQYVATYSDLTATRTYGMRSVFARLAQHTVGLQARINWVLRPDLTLQGYTQGLLSASSFSNYSALALPRTYRFDIYGAGA